VARRFGFRAAAAVQKRDAARRRGRRGGSMTLLRLDKLCANAETIDRFEAGGVVFAEGADGDFLYVVVDGNVEVMVGDKLVDIAGPGDILGEMALIDSKPRSATAIARTPARLARLDEGEFLSMVQDIPFFSLHVMRVLVARMRRMNARV
jgi:CRP/FNR family cyclic AMP-dependent transcriptional regulator